MRVLKTEIEEYCGKLLASLAGSGYEGMPVPLRRMEQDEGLLRLRSRTDALGNDGTGAAACGDGETRGLFKPSEVLARHRRFVLQGAPGSGRSSALRLLASERAREGDGLVPVPVKLSTVLSEPEDSRDIPSPSDLALHAARTAGLDDPAVLERLIPTGRLLWLLDDVPAPDGHHSWQRLDILLRNLPGAVVVATGDDVQGSFIQPSLPHFALNDFDPRDFGDLLAELCRPWCKDDGEAQSAAAKLASHAAANPALWHPLRRLFNIALFASYARCDRLPHNHSELFAFILDRPDGRPLDELSAERAAWRDFAEASGLAASWNTEPPVLSRKECPGLHRAGRHRVLCLAAGLSYRQALEDLVKGLLKRRSPYEAALKRDLRLCARLLGQQAAGRDEDSPLRAKVIARLRSLSGTPDWRYPALLALSFVAGLLIIAFNVAPPWTEHALLGWIVLWALAFAVPYFPLFRDSLSLPTRLFKPPPDTHPFVEAALHLGREALPVLTAALASRENADSQREALLQLGRLGPPVDDGLPGEIGRILTDTACRDDVRSAAAEALASFPLPESVRSLSTVLRSPHATPGTRHRAAVSLALLSAEMDSAWAALEEGLDHQDHAVREITSSAVSRSTRLADALDRLIELCADSYPEIRIEALRALAVLAGAAGGGVGGRAAGEGAPPAKDAPSLLRLPAPGDIQRMIETTARCILDHNGDVRLQAEHTAGAIGEAAVPRILQLALDEELDTDGRISAVTALGRIGGPAVLDAARRCLALDFHKFRAAAVFALSSTGLDDVIPDLERAADDEWGSVRSPALEALAEKLGHEARPYLVKALSDRDRDVRRTAVSLLLDLRAPGVVDDIIETLDDPDFEVRRDGVRALGRLGSTKAVPRLTAMLDDVNSSVRQAVPYALAAIGDPSAIEHIAVALADGEADVRWAAAEALATFEAGLSVPVLAELLAVDDWMIRRNAVAALGATGSPSALPHVMTCLEDHDSDVKRAAAAAVIPLTARLGGTGATAGAALQAPPAQASEGDGDPSRQPGTGSGPDTRVEPTGGDGGGPLAEALAALTSDEAENVRAQAALSLGEAAASGVCPPEACARAVVPLIVDGAVFVRRAAAEALGRISDPDATAALVKALDDVSWEVRKTAAQALGAQGSPAAVDALTEMLEAADPNMRSHTLDSLLLLCSRCKDRQTLEKAASALWWRMTDDRAIAVQAFHALEEVAGNISRIDFAESTAGGTGAP